MNFPLLSKLLASLTAILLVSCSTTTLDQDRLSLSASTVSAPKDYGILLDKYVTPQGVDYQKWASASDDLSKLEEVTNYYANRRPPEAEKESLAWHLNAYNSWILQSILTSWPNEGPLDASLLFFHKKKIVVSGTRMSLLHFENKVIRKNFQEPRIHFALNCASRSCPPLNEKPFEAKSLDSTLDRLTKNFLNHNPNALREAERQVQLSKIFDWYTKDFGGRKNLIPFINQYRDQNQQLSLDKQISFLPYNWQLNTSS